MDVNKLNIDGNICGTYGLITNDTHTFYLNVRAKELSLKGDINFGSKGDSASHSYHGRKTIVNVNADRGTMSGNVHGFERGHVGIFSEQGLEITGNITVEDLGNAYLGALLKNDGTIEKEGGPVLDGLPKGIHSHEGALIAGLGLFDKEGIKVFEKNEICTSCEPSDPRETRHGKSRTFHLFCIRKNY